MSRPVSARVDWLACDGHGLCAQAAPEVVTLDDWGYPIVASGPLPQRLTAAARTAARVCPKLALHVERTR